MLNFLSDDKKKIKRSEIFKNIYIVIYWCPLEFVNSLLRMSKIFVIAENKEIKYLLVSSFEVAILYTFVKK